MRIIFFVAFCLHTLFLLGQSSDAVFPDFQGVDLLSAVVTAYTPKDILSYGQARDTMFAVIDSYDDSLTCVYSGHTIYLSPDLDPTQAAFMNGSSDGINTEHTYPQSLGAGQGNARSDMHHLFPTRTAVNSSRGNKPFAEIEDSTADVWHYLNQTAETMPSDDIIDLYSESNADSFEPRESHKGDVARAIFYFYTIYREQADEPFFESQVQDLCRWHIEDPADDREMDRSEMIAVYQDGKVNPFVFDCTLATRLYCPDQSCDVTSVEDVYQADLAVYPNPASSHVTIDLPDHLVGTTIAIYNSYGTVMHSQAVLNNTSSISVDLITWPVGVYLVYVVSSQRRYESIVLIKH